MAHIVGIDLGTTHSLVAYLDQGAPKIIPNSTGGRATPSVVGIDAQGRLHVGASAREQLRISPEWTVAEAKRLMGTSERIRLGDRTYTPTEISGIILRALREDAERHFGTTVTEAVVTVPAYFTDAQRQATKDAGELAGFRVERIINEPTAAALAYGIERLDAEEHVVVYDLGGGTFDVSVLEMFGGVLDVKASAGNNRLGGGDFDRALVDWFLQEITRMHGIDVRGDLRAMARLTAAAERAKIDLSTEQTAVVRLPSIATKAGSEVAFELEVRRTKFEQLVEPLVRSTLGCLDGALGDAKLGKATIAQVVMVGGSSRVPLVRRLVAEYFGKEPAVHVNPDEAVALGAAVQVGLKTGAISAQTGIMITDVAPFTLGVETQSRAGSQVVDGIFAAIIPRNSTIPVSRSERFGTTYDGQKKVTIRVYQGESRYTKNNVFLDEYTIDGVPPAPQGRESVSVEFTYDINGILNVTTEILSTGKKASMTIHASPQRMSDDDRVRAKERIEQEWSGKPAGAHATGSSATGSNVSNPNREAKAPTAGATAASVDAENLRAVLAVAAEKMKSPAGRAHPKLNLLVRDAEEALQMKDDLRIGELERAITDLLFSME